MSTRATIHFTYGDRTEAIVYRHGDGYPEGLGKDLQEFFSTVKAQTDDTRFGDSSYLAAKWVVYDADRLRHLLHKPALLDFLSIGIVMEDPGDIEYRYTVDCGIHDEKG